MNLTVIFEHWHLGDGNYPAFRRGDHACLSFELGPHAVARVPENTPLVLRQVLDAEHHCVARVVRIYRQESGSPLVVFETAGFRFYSLAEGVAALKLGDVVQVHGPLLLDHYMWVEFLDRYPDSPDLFYRVRIDRIRVAAVPERFISSSVNGVGGPTSVGPEDYGDPREVTQVGEDAEAFSFSLLDLTILPDTTEPKKPTFFEA